MQTRESLKSWHLETAAKPEAWMPWLHSCICHFVSRLQRAVCSTHKSANSSPLLSKHFKPRWTPFGDWLQIETTHIYENINNRGECRGGIPNYVHFKLRMAPFINNPNNHLCRLVHSNELILLSAHIQDNILHWVNLAGCTYCFQTKLFRRRKNSSNNKLWWDCSHFTSAIPGAVQGHFKDLYFLKTKIWRSRFWSTYERLKQCVSPLIFMSI